MEENSDVIKKKRHKKEKKQRRNRDKHVLYSEDHKKENKNSSKEGRRVLNDTSSDISLPSTLDVYMEKVELLDVTPRGSDSPKNGKHYSGKDSPDDAGYCEHRSKRNHQRHRLNDTWPAQTHFRDSPENRCHSCDIDGMQRFSSPSNPKKAYSDISNTATKGQNGPTLVEKCRQAFKDEMMVLRAEVDDFRKCCYNQIFEQRTAVERIERNAGRMENTRATDRHLSETQFEYQMMDMERNAEYIRRRQSYLEKERVLLDKEEEMAGRQKSLEQYEEEILAVEKMLLKRQEICDGKQRDLDNMEQELHNLKDELEASREEIASNRATISSRENENWEVVKTRLLEHQGMLEKRVQKYRTELASATATMAGKDLLIKQLQQMAVDQEQYIREKANQIENLELRLTCAIKEKTKLESELRRESLSSTASRPRSPSKQQQRNNSSGESSVSSPFKKCASDSPSTSAKGQTSCDDVRKAESGELQRDLPLSNKQTGMTADSEEDVESATDGNADRIVRDCSTKIIRHPFDVKHSTDGIADRTFSGGSTKMIRHPPTSNRNGDEVKSLEKGNSEDVAGAGTTARHPLSNWGRESDSDENEEDECHVNNMVPSISGNTSSSCSVM